MPTVWVAVDEITAAARVLARAGDWNAADRLLDAARAGDGRGAAGADAGADAGAGAAGVPDGSAPGSVLALALAAAECAVDRDFVTGTRLAPQAIAEAEVAAAQAAGPTERWDLDFLRLRQEYGSELFSADGQPAFGPGGRDPARVAQLAERALGLLQTAPDEGRAGWAGFYRGLVADNLAGDQATAQVLFTRALDSAEQAEDAYLESEALRHLGGHDEEAGDLRRARSRWERSAELWAGAGYVPGVLAQQQLLAELAAREGGAAAASVLAGEVSRWAGALGLGRLQRQAEGFRIALARGAPHEP
jgi:hypothetical protein